MINSKKRQLVIALILACAFMPAVGAEPNEAGTELKFEISSETRGWFTKIPAGESPTTGSGPIRPTHAAELFIWNLPRKRYRAQPGDAYKYRPSTDFSTPESINDIMNTSAARSMSRQQRDFLTTGNAIVTIGDFGDTVGNHFHFRLYAVGEGDAKKMAQALVEFPTSQANRKLRSWISRGQELRGKIPDRKKEISAKKAELKSTETRLKELKKTVHYLMTSEAKDTILELNKTLDELNIRIAGMRATLEATSEAISSTRSGSDLRHNLEERRIQQMVELKAAEAEKETATRIRNQAKEFFDLVNLRGRLPQRLSSLRSNLGDFEKDLREVEKVLANPAVELLPPRVFQNKVTIYPVRVD